MTTYQLMRRAVQNFRNFNVPKHVQRNYQQQWIQCITRLGPNWVLHDSPTPRSYYGRS